MAWKAVDQWRISLDPLKRDNSWLATAIVDAVFLTSRGATSIEAVKGVLRQIGGKANG